MIDDLMKEAIDTTEVIHVNKRLNFVKNLVAFSEEMISLKGFERSRLRRVISDFALTA